MGTLLTTNETKGDMLIKCALDGYMHWSKPIGHIFNYLFISMFINYTSKQEKHWKILFQYLPGISRKVVLREELR